MNDIESKIKAAEAANGCIKTDREGFRRFFKANHEVIAWSWAEKAGWYWDEKNEDILPVDSCGYLRHFEDAFGPDSVFKFIPCDDELMVHVTEGNSILAVLNILVNAASTGQLNLTEWFTGTPYMSRSTANE